MFRDTSRQKMQASINKIEKINHTEAKNTQAVEKAYFDIRDACVDALFIYLKTFNFPKHKNEAKKLMIDLETATSFEKVKSILYSAYQSLDSIQYKSTIYENEKIGRFHTIVKISAEKTFPLSGLHYENCKREQEELKQSFVTKKR